LAPPLPAEPRASGQREFLRSTHERLFPHAIIRDPTEEEENVKILRRATHDAHAQSLLASLAVANQAALPSDLRTGGHTCGTVAATFLNVKRRKNLYRLIPKCSAPSARFLIFREIPHYHLYIALPTEFGGRSQ
jgi:hypothetical protein